MRLGTERLDGHRSQPVHPINRHRHCPTPTHRFRAPGDTPARARARDQSIRPDHPTPLNDPIWNRDAGHARRPDALRGAHARRRGNRTWAAGARWNIAAGANSLTDRDYRVEVPSTPSLRQDPGPPGPRPLDSNRIRAAAHRRTKRDGNTDRTDQISCFFTTFFDARAKN